MKFVYHYKTSDGMRHEGVYRAASRDAVYAELKEKGVKPFGVELAPGILNRVQSIGKRGVAIVLLAVVCVALAVIVVRVVLDASGAAANLTPRHQLYGDPARIDEFTRTGFSVVFVHPGEQYLAHYAQPGVAPNYDTLSRLPVASLAASLTNAVAFVKGDSREARELKQIVLWMKDELREYLSDGVGTSESYAKRLEQRLREELEIFNRAENEVAVEGAAKLEQINERLRNIGLKTIVSPDEEGVSKK